MTVPTTTVNPGSTFTVSVAGGPGNPTDWVSMSATSAPDTTLLYWQYLNGQRTTLPTTGLTSATLQFVAPTTPGTYNIRLFASNGWTKLATSASINVQGPTPTVTVPSTAVNTGSTFTVTVANGPGNPTDWISLGTTAAADTGYISWEYLNGLGTGAAPTTGMTGTTLQLVAPMTPGSYNVRFFSNNGWTKIATSNTITVQAPPAITTLRQTLGLPAVANTAGFSSVGVAIIDSGITPNADFAGRITGFYDFTNGLNAVPVTPYDDYGHGTHVAGLIGSSGV